MTVFFGKFTILALSCHTTTDMALLLIYFKNVPDLCIKLRVLLFQTLAYILMYGAF